MRMPLRRLLPCAVLVALATGAAVARAEDFGSPAFQQFREQFLAMRMDSLHARRAQSVLLERAAGSFVLNDGVIAFAGPVGAGGRAAVFVGQGTFVFTPTSAIEREQLRRFFGTTALRVALKSATFFFTDSTLRELTEATHVQDGSAPAALGATLVESRRYLLRNKRKDVDVTAALSMLEQPPAGWFWAHLVDTKGKSYFFTLDPWDAERVQLLRTPDDEQSGLYRRYSKETICKFAAAGDSMPARDERPNVVVADARLRLEFDDALKVRGTATYTLLGVAPSSRWFTTVMHADLWVDSVHVEGRDPETFRRPTRFYRDVTTNTWWIDLGAPLAAGEKRTVRFAYHGEMFERMKLATHSEVEERNRGGNVKEVGPVTEEEWLVFRDVLLWHPYALFSNRATWDLSFRVPRGYPLVASGELESSREEGGFVESRWRTTDVAYLSAFCLDFMRSFEVTDGPMKPLRVWFHSPGRSGQNETWSMAQLADTRSYEGSVTRDVARAAQFYTGAIGAPRVKQLNAVESPLRTYFAFPNLMHMMRKADQYLPGAAFSTDFIRAHELAHQWWGYGVTPRTYHDVWLNEAFADFSALWYVQAGRGDMNSYLQILRSLKEYLLQNRQYVFGPGQKAGPIWLGPRLESSTTEGDYSLVIYKKGAWVLHMLRTMLSDANRGDDATFRAMMSDFYARHSGSYATTEDFRAAAERAVGEDLGWFFDQWVYGTDVPRYRVTWRTSPVGEGAAKQWQVNLHVEQQGVPETFRMPVMVRVNFGADQYARTRVWVNGPVTDVTLPLAPKEPTALVFNDVESVLCEVESVKKE